MSRLRVRFSGRNIKRRSFSCWSSLRVTAARNHDIGTFGSYPKLLLGRNLFGRSRSARAREPTKIDPRTDKKCASRPKVAKNRYFGLAPFLFALLAALLVNNAVPNQPQ